MIGKYFTETSNKVEFKLTMLELTVSDLYVKVIVLNHHKSEAYALQ